MDSKFHTINENDFKSEFTKLIENKESFLAYFHGAYNTDGGKSWCSDCDIAKPIIDKILPEAKVSVYKFPIQESKEWKRQDYEYRINPKVKLSKVPTLIYYEKGIEFGRLTEEELFNADTVNEFINQIA
jgi:thiol-disulfide isomerase/thioredoxin